MEISGTIVKIKDVEIITPKSETAKQFSKRELWLEIPDEKYPQTIAMEVHNEKTNLLDSFTEGQEVTLKVNLKGRIVEGRCFNTFQVWQIQEKK